MAQCDRYGYAEDQAPVASHALWSADAVTWSSYELEGEAYEEPGISPERRNAVWPSRRLRHPHRGRDSRATDLDTRGLEYTATATITDEAQVSYLYGAT